MAKRRKMSARAVAARARAALSRGTVVIRERAPQAIQIVRERVRSAPRRFVAGAREDWRQGHVKSAGMTALVAAGVGYAFNYHLADWKSNKDRWWLYPALGLAVGYYLHRKGNPQGRVVMALAVMMAFQNYRRDQQAKQQQQPQQQPPAPQLARQDTSGPGLPHGATGWYRLPNGSYVSVPQQSFAPDSAGARLAAQIYRPA